jgi:tRNA threonylcarbamoyladenosine modification (KEOPS) complex  Pcc1 subunit
MITANLTIRNVEYLTLQKAIGPELDNELSRARVEMKRLEDGISLRFMADDVVALRASMNSYLRWLKLITDIDEELKKDDARSVDGA